MSFGICRVEKVKSTGIYWAQYHNDRFPGEHSNVDIDLSRTHLNQELCRHGDYREEVDSRIERFRTSTKAVRKDAVLLVDGMMTASPEFFEGKSDEEVLAFFHDSYRHLCAEVGEENMIYFTIHMDEGSPHAHFGFTPIKDGRLSWKAFFNGRQGLSAFQDRFHGDVFAKYGLERGLKDTGRKHVETNRYKAQAEAAVEKEMEQLTYERDAARWDATKAKEDLKAVNVELDGAKAYLDVLNENIDAGLDTAAGLNDEIASLRVTLADGREAETALVGRIHALEEYLKNSMTEIYVACARITDAARGTGKELSAAIAKVAREAVETVGERLESAWAVAATKDGILDTKGAQVARGDKALAEAIVHEGVALSDFTNKVTSEVIIAQGGHELTTKETIDRSYGVAQPVVTKPAVVVPERPKVVLPKRTPHGKRPQPPEVKAYLANVKSSLADYHEVVVSLKGNDFNTLPKWKCPAIPTVLRTNNTVGMFIRSARRKSEVMCWDNASPESRPRPQQQKQGGTQGGSTERHYSEPSSYDYPQERSGTER